MTTKFNVQDVKDAYEKCGWTPTNGEFINQREQCCCPLASLYISNLGDVEIDDEIIIKWTEDYLNSENSNNSEAFIHGVDDTYIEEDMDFNDEEREYYLLGVKIRQELNL